MVYIIHQHSVPSHLDGTAGGSTTSTAGSFAIAARLTFDADLAFKCRCLADSSSAQSGFEGTLPIKLPSAFILQFNAII